MVVRGAEGIMATRALSILALAAVVVTGSAVCALAESKSEAAIKNPRPESKTPEASSELVNPNTRPELTNPNIRAGLTLRCQPQLGSTQVLCSETAPSAKPLIKSETTFATSFSLHTANNLATKETTAKFLQSVTGNQSLARKFTPTFMRISKSVPARYGLAAVVLGSGAIAVYERFYGDDDKTAAKPSQGGLTYVLVGEVDRNGNYKEAARQKP
jgi:hypothetical protein